MKNSTKKFSLITVLAAIFAAFAIFATLSAVESSGANVAFADEKASLLETKAKVSLDNKYLLLITGFDPALIDPNGYYYMGYKYTVGETAVDTGRRVSQAYYYASVTLRTDLEDATKTQEVTPQMIYGEDYADYKLLVYEIEFEHSFSEDIAEYSNIRAYIDHVDESGTSIIDSVEGDSFTYSDRDKYFPTNNKFEQGLEGWTRETVISDNGKHFGGISEATTFWGEAYPMFNEGKYFSSYADDSAEGSTGTLTSSSFELGGSGWITFKFGGAGNPLCYITVEKQDNNEDWTAIAVYRNTAFRDLPANATDYSVEERRTWIGDTVFLANLVTFKADLSDYIGETLRFVIHDEATGGWGVVYFDELITYYTSEARLPSATPAVNQLADKSALEAAIDGAVTEQGDYTEESYSAYVAALNAAREVDGYVASTQTAVNEALAALNGAELVYRTPSAREAERNFVLAPEATQTITIAEQVDDKELSSVSYAVSVDDAAVAAVSEIDNGAFTITAVSDGNATVTLSVTHHEQVVLTVEFTVEVTTAPSLREQTVTVNVDLYSYDGESYVIDFTDNVTNNEENEFEYSVTMGGEEISLTDNAYVYALNGDYSDDPVTVNFVVTVANGTKSVQYAFVLNITDSTDYRIANGGFETGDLIGWTITNAQIGAVTNATNYWINDPESAEGYAFGKDGEYLFSAYATDVETATGSLTSSDFVIGGSGYITYKLGAGKNPGYVWVDVIEKDSGDILARYYNQNWADTTNGVKTGCTLNAYKANLSAHKGKTVYLRFVDSASYDYGLFFLDSVETYHASEPTGEYNLATALTENIPADIYNIYNGCFETGDLSGWAISDHNNPIGQVTDASQYFSRNSYNKDSGDDYHFSGIEDLDRGNGKESNQGTLTSSPFTVGGIGYITFKLGGGVNNACYIDIIDYTTGEVLARYFNENHMTSAEYDHPNGIMVRYKADLSAYLNRTVAIKVCDFASSNWGCMAIDSFVTYYANAEAIPADSTVAVDYKNKIVNGGFEKGNLDFWTMNVTNERVDRNKSLGAVVESEVSEGWYQTNEDRKEGKFLFTFYPAAGDANNYEWAMGTLKSSEFILQQNSIISFRLGAALNNDRQVYITLRSSDGTILAKFYNDSPVDQTHLQYYYYEVGNKEEMSCYFIVEDYAEGNYYGCFVVDDFSVNLASVPDGAVKANDQK